MTNTLVVCSKPSFLPSALPIQQARSLPADDPSGRCLSQNHRRGHRYVQYRFRRERRKPVHAAGSAEGESQLPYFLVDNTLESSHRLHYCSFVCRDILQYLHRAASMRCNNMVACTRKQRPRRISEMRGFEDHKVLGPRFFSASTLYADFAAPRSYA